MSVAPTLIAEIGRHVDTEVEIAGWLYNLRSKGKIHFLQLRDGSGRLQAVAVQGECDPASFAAIGLFMSTLTAHPAARTFESPLFSIGLVGF